MLRAPQDIPEKRASMGEFREEKEMQRSFVFALSLP